MILKTLKPLPMPGRKLAQRGGLNQSGALQQHEKSAYGKDHLLFHSHHFHARQTEKLVVALCHQSDYSPI
jgi:hypothetical protein